MDHFNYKSAKIFYCRFCKSTSLPPVFFFWLSITKNSFLSLLLSLWDCPNNSISVPCLRSHPEPSGERQQHCMEQVATHLTQNMLGSVDEDKNTKRKRNKPHVGFHSSAPLQITTIISKGREAAATGAGEAAWIKCWTDCRPEVL